MAMGLARLSWTYTGSRWDDRTYFTPADRFYHVDHGGIPLAIAPESWCLQISGYVASPRTITFADLQARLQSRGITRYVKCLQCLRDPLGDDIEKRWYASSGLWGGLPLSDVLEEAGIQPGAARIDYGGRDPSGFFASAPLEQVMSPGGSGGLPVLLATELNGVPLIHERGGPVRLLVPGMLGFKSVKWLNWICVTDGAAPNGWYERGRGVHLPPCQKDPMLKTMARIAPVYDACGQLVHPRLGRFEPGQPLMFRGYAVAGPRGLASVRYRVTCAGGFHHGVIHEGVAGFEVPGNWGLPGGIPAGVTHFNGSQPAQWPLPLAWTYWQAPFGPLSPGKYRFEVWAADREGHEQPMPDPNEHSGSARREEVVFRVG
jgi:sulfite oxidase